MSNIYEVLPLNEDQAFKLFSKHAFLKGSPTPDFIDLSRGIVRETGMLPLALEVIGSSLSAEIKETWQATLKKLLRVKPEKEVQDRLRISYDGLSFTEKHIFLDIACLFIGMDSRIAIPMWDDCDWFPQTGIQILILKSLIKIRNGTEFWMHDQLRDLGREIVEAENYRHPGSRSRLWRLEEAVRVLNRKEGTSEVEAVNLYCWDLVLAFKSDQFRNLPNLRILQLHRASLDGGLLMDLRWLSWKVSLSDPIPTNLDLRNLISLDLSGSSVEEDWGGWSLMKVASKLKVLDLTRCWNVRKTPDLSPLRALERLILHSCENLLSIDPSIEQLSAQVSLDLRECWRMEGLPNLEHLTNLEELYLGRWRLLHSGPNRISKVPGLQGLISLEILKIGSSCITHLDGLEMLERLRELEIFFSPIERLPSSSKLRRLTHITLKNCEKLRHVQVLGDELESLETLTIRSCPWILKLPDLSKLAELQSLIIDNCARITEIGGLDLGSVKHVEISQCSALTRLPNISKLRKLRTLRISTMFCLLEIAGLEELDNLENLDIIHCFRIMKLPNLSKLRALRKLNIKAWGENITEIPGLEDLESLEHVRIVDARIEILPNLSKLGRLIELNITQCRDLAEFGELGRMDHLKSLDIRFSEWIEKLPDLSELHRLQKLRIVQCRRLKEVRGLGNLRSLETLVILYCDALASLPGMSELPRLTYIAIKGCGNLPEIVVGVESLGYDLMYD